MKIKNIQLSVVLYLFFAVLVFFVGCKEEQENIDIDIEQGQEDKKSEENIGSPVLRFLSFTFSKTLNPQLTIDVRGKISDNKVTVMLPEAAANFNMNLIPSFIGEYKTVKVNGELQTSGVNVQDFNKIVHYELISEKGEVKTYEVSVKIFTGIPIVWIETESAQEITSKENYVNGNITISKAFPFTEDYQGSMRIKGRGNATWFSYPKKPYRIKLDSKSKILGMPADKDWVLLAEYCDKSLLRTTYAFELSKLMELPWSPRGYHVELFLNDLYNGTYFLCEHVKEAADRVDIEKDGYLIENDNNWDKEPIWFTTTQGLHYTFKYPDTDEMTVGDDNYNFILNYMNEFENVLYSDYFDDPKTGYRKYIDSESFAKWYLLQETLGNAEPNPYYVLESRTGKLKMYPAWDFEWSLGLAFRENDEWVMPPRQSPVAHLYHRNIYFSRLFQDPYFVSIVKKEWTKVKECLPELADIISEKAENIKYAQNKNFSRWPILGKYISVGLVKFDTWDEEVNYAKNFLDDRVRWLNLEIESW